MEEEGYAQMKVMGVKDGYVHVIFRTDEFAMDMLLPPETAKDVAAALILTLAEIDGTAPTAEVIPDPDPGITVR